MSVDIQAIVSAAQATGSVNPRLAGKAANDDPMQKTLKAFIERRHPEYEEKLPVWDFLEATYNGGRDWFNDGNIFRYVKEGDNDYEERVKRCYRFNHTREVTDLVQKYIFKAPITRNADDAPGEIKAFWENATLSGLDINQFMKTVSTGSSIFGRGWIFTDTTKTAEILSLADEKKEKARVYAYFVKPQNILDAGFTQQGELNWVLVRETVRDDADAIASTGEITEQFRLWERNSWTLFRITEEGTGRRKRYIVEIIDENPHGLGVVPGFPVDHTVGDYRWSSPSLIGDIAYLDRAVANYLSNLDAIIQDQTFSQLAMPAQAVLPGEDTYEALLEGHQARVHLRRRGRGAPEFLSPDPKQAQLLLLGHR
jgi:hypothetical protein